MSVVLWPGLDVGRVHVVLPVHLRGYLLTWGAAFNVGGLEGRVAHSSAKFGLGSLFVRLGLHMEAMYMVSVRWGNSQK